MYSFGSIYCKIYLNITFFTPNCLFEFKLGLTLVNAYLLRQVLKTETRSLNISLKEIIF